MKQEFKKQCSNFLLSILTDYKKIDYSALKNNFEILELSNYICDIIKDNSLFKSVKKICDGIYVVGNFIIKIKSCNIPEKICFTEEMVETYYRKNYEILHKNKYYCFGIEIQKYIDSSYKCTEDELYNVYLSLRKKGYIWVDVSINNVKKDNDKILIVDLDYIYHKDNVNLFNQSYLSKKFEERYKQTYN